MAFASEGEHSVSADEALWGTHRTKSLHHCPAKGRAIEGGELVDELLYFFEIADGLLRIDQFPSEHLPHVVEVLGVSSFHLGKSLGVEVECRNAIIP